MYPMTEKKYETKIQIQYVVKKFVFLCFCASQRSFIFSTGSGLIKTEQMNATFLTDLTVYRVLLQTMKFSPIFF
jgi:hypothetical protein